MVVVAGPVVTGVDGGELFCAAGVRVGAGLALRLANKRAIALELLYGTSRVQRTHARGHLVAGATAATSSCGGELRARWLV